MGEKEFNELSLDELEPVAGGCSEESRFKNDFSNLT